MRCLLCVESLDGDLRVTDNLDRLGYTGRLFGMSLDPVVKCQYKFTPEFELSIILEDSESAQFIVGPVIRDGPSDGSDGRQRGCEMQQDMCCDGIKTEMKSHENYVPRCKGQDVSKLVDLRV